MKRIIALDLGDVWVGVAQTDLSQTLTKPCAVWKANELARSLREYVQKNPIDEVVIGIPFTLSGGESKQTKKVRLTIEYLKKTFPELSFFEQDERLSSKFSQRCSLQCGKSSKAQGSQEHARAAAIILENFLCRRSNSQISQQD